MCILFFAVVFNFGNRHRGIFHRDIEEYIAIRVLYVQIRGDSLHILWMWFLAGCYITAVLTSSLRSTSEGKHPLHPQTEQF